MMPSLEDGTPWRGIDAEACYRYALSRQSPTGGFCYYNYSPWGVEDANAPDTHAAIAIFQLLCRPVPNVERCVDWLRSLQDSAGAYPTLLIAHAALKALRLLGAAPTRNPSLFIQDAARAAGATASNRHDLRSWLANAALCSDLWLDFPIILADEMRHSIGATRRRLRHESDGYGWPGPDLVQTWMAVSLGDALGVPTEMQTLDFVQRCQGPPLGFNITPDAVSSSLDCQLAGVRLGARFGARLADPTSTRTYVARCQTAAGGFGRAPGAIPRLGDSWKALDILVSLDAVASPSITTGG